MGRAVVRDPPVFVFDEPLSNLDAKLRNQMRTEIKRLHRQVETTIVYVTHDQVEAMTLADRIVVLRDGHIQQIGTPLELFHEPANLFVAGFIGSPAMNFIDGHLDTLSTSPTVRLNQELALPIVRPLGTNAQDGMKVVVGIRPDDLEIASNGPAGPSTYRMWAPINVVEPMGSETIVFLELAAIEVIGKARGRNLPALGMAEFDLLAEAHPDRLVWGGTAAGWLGFDLDRYLCERIEERTGIPATSSLLATNARLRELGVRRIGLVTPYEQELETRIIGIYKAAGTDVVASERLDITVNTEYANVPPTQIFEMSKTVAQNGAEAIVILCTNLAGAAIINAASEAMGLPVLVSVEETFRPLVRLASETNTV